MSTFVDIFTEGDLTRARGATENKRDGNGPLSPHPRARGDSKRGGDSPSSPASAAAQLRDGADRKLTRKSGLDIGGRACQSGGMKTNVRVFVGLVLMALAGGAEAFIRA